MQKFSTHAVQAHFENQILNGLRSEWELAVMDLGSEFQKALKLPQMILTDAQRTLGLWCPETHEMHFSRSFVMNARWDSVVACLKHELAHMCVSVFYPGTHETAHGPLFQQMCNIIGADPSASGHYVSLEQRVLDEQVHDQDRLLLRVKKLLALAESSNPHEAQSAMAKANDLIHKYNLEQVENNHSRDFVSIFLGSPALRHPVSKRQLIHLLESFYCVSIVWIQSFVPEKGKIGRVPEMSGQAVNCSIAHYIYDYVLHYIDGQWAAHRRKHKLTHHRKNSFACGVIEGFYNKLKAQRQYKSGAGSSHADMKHLLVIEDKALERYVQQRYGRLSRTRSRYSCDSSVRKAGYEAGKQLVIAKGIGKKEGFKGKLLG